MYQIYCDDYLLFDNALDSLKIFSPKMSIQLNCVFSLEFIIYPEHPYFEQIKKMKSIIKVVEDGMIVFRGRVINDKSGIYNEKKIECEGDLAFLIDSIQRPYEFQGSPSDLFRQFITNHNAQVAENHQFKIGNITVTDPNDYINRSDTTYQNTFEAISDKLIEGLGGYLWVRYEDDGAYIDYLEDFNVLSNQRIEFGKNLLSYSHKVSADDVFTVIIPLGASDEEGNRIDIKSVNSGRDYLEHSEGISRYGRITKVVEWDDVTIPNNLKTKAQKALDDAVLMTNTIEITAADLSAINQDINSFKLGSKVRVTAEPYNLDAIYLVTRLYIDMLNPASNVLTLGTEYKSFTDKSSGERKTIANQIITKSEQTKIQAVAETQKQYQSEIAATSDAIVSSVSERFYLKDQTDALISEVATNLKQTADTFEFQFNTFSQDLNNVINGTDAEFENFRKYIRFRDGLIEIGQLGNSLELQLTNDRIRFLQNKSEVAYFSNNKLFVTDGEYTNSLQLGKFAFLPRTSGNLSFKKVRD